MLFLHSWCYKFLSGIIFLILSEELPLVNLRGQVCWQLILTFIYLRMSLFHLNSWKIFLLDIKFWVHGSFLSLFKKKWFHCIFCEYSESIWHFWVDLMSTFLKIYFISLNLPIFLNEFLLRNCSSFLSSSTQMYFFFNVVFLLFRTS